MTVPSGSAGNSAVSVIIPTTLRPQLPVAVESAKAQSIGRHRVHLVIVADVNLDPDSLAAWKKTLNLGSEDLMIATGGGHGGGGARKMGTKLATGDWIAYLDDDDEWDVNKLELQIEHLLALGEDRHNCVVATRVRQRNVADGRTSRIVPSTALTSGQQLEEYLFRRRSANIGRATMYTSTLMTSAQLAKRVQWRQDLKRHQDWDWLLRAAAQGARVEQLESPLVTIWTGSEGSISGSKNWKASLEWGLECGADWNPHVLSDFLTAQTLRYALHARSFEGIRNTIAAIVRTRRIPSLSCLVIALGGVMNRKLLELILMGPSFLRNSEPSKQQLAIFSKIKRRHRN